MGFQRRSDMSDPLKGVMDGAGFFAGFQAEAWGRIDAAQITAVADGVPGKAREFSDRYGIAGAYESVDEMLDREQPEFVAVATRPDSHLALVKNATERGIAVICQKPMAPGWLIRQIRALRCLSERHKEVCHPPFRGIRIFCPRNCE